MGMLDQMLANLYKPTKQEKPTALPGKLSAHTAKASQIAKTLSASQGLSNTPATVAQGQFLRGEVLDLRANQILVLLENGVTVSARTEGTLNLSIGENARFFVAQTTEDQVLLKLAKEEGETENPMIEKALTSSGISRTERSVSIVTELLSHSQPVTETNIRHYLSLSAKYPELPAKDFILMELHNIPVTQENVSRFTEYHDGNGKLLTQAATLIEEVTAQIERLPEGEIKEHLMQEFTQIMETHANVESPATQTWPTPETVSPQHVSPQDTASSQSTPLQEDTVSSYPSQTTPVDAGIPQSASPDIVVTTASTTPNAPAEPASLFPDLLDSFLLSPEEVADSEKVKEYYEELNQKLEILEQFTLKLAETTKETEAAAPKQMKSNLSFMESVNQVFGFLQLPLKFKENTAHGELYVYERKKALKPTDSFSALLHLDLEALGSMDVFITLAGQNVTSRFSLTDKPSADLVRTELPSLSEALAKKGYSLQSNVTVREPETEEHSPTLLEQFLEERAPGGLERYTFDIRA